MAPVPILEQLTVRTPCRVPWDSLQGDDRTRFCTRCHQDVHNLEFMTRDEAQALLSSDERVCVRFFRRPDGTVITRDCQEPARAARRRFVTRFLLGLSLFGHLFTGFDWFRRQRKKRSSVVMGGIGEFENPLPQVVPRPPAEIHLHP